MLCYWCFTCFPALSQNIHLFRIYEDNDFINIAGKGTDKGYTNGTRFDYFYQKGQPSRFLPDRWFPRAGTGSVNTFSYSLMQVMLVPRDISKPEPDKNDWPYSGGLVISHGLHSSHPVRKWSLRTEIVAGIIGPLSFAEQTQTWIHSIIGYTKPMGWNHQIPGDVLLNINFQAEKMIWQPVKAVEVLGGGEIHVGTMLDGTSLHVQIRAGDFQPYFDSYIGRFMSGRKTGKRRIQYYFFLKPSVQWWTYNARVQGGLFSGKGSYYAGVDSRGQSPSLKTITATLDAGFVFVAGNVGLSFIQKEMSPLIHKVSDQTVGNISVTYSW